MPFKNVVAVINFWDGCELLPYAVDNWHKLGIPVMIVYSNISNHGQALSNTKFLNSPTYKDCILKNVEPVSGLPAMDNERRKRQAGLDETRKLGFTHIITADIDEFYEPFEVDWESAGTVVPCKTYFKSPTLTVGFDITLAPFVHKITPTLAYAFNRSYPFAWQGPSIRIDPTRSFNINSGVVLREDIVMHHYSYVRQDISQKIANSSARGNMNGNQILEDMRLAKPGYLCKTYQKVLHDAPNIFNLPTNW